MQKDKWRLLKCWDVSPAPFHCKIHLLNKKGAWWSLKCVVRFLLWSKVKIRVTEWEMTGKPWWSWYFLSTIVPSDFVLIKSFLCCFFYLCGCLYVCFSLRHRQKIIKCMPLHVYVHVCVNYSTSRRFFASCSLWLDIMWKYFLYRLLAHLDPLLLSKTVCRTAQTFEPEVKNVSKDHWLKNDTLQCRVCMLQYNYSVTAECIHRSRFE